MRKWCVILGMAVMAALLIGASLAQAQVLPQINITANEVAGGPIETFAFPAGGVPIASFVPDGAKVAGANGRGIAIGGNNIYYTELSGAVGPTDVIRVAPYNGGAGGTDIGTLPNPDPTHGIQDLAFSGGFLYAMTGYDSATTPTVWKLNPNTGAVLSSVVLSGPAIGGSDGFTVLPSGNFLVNQGDDVNSYDQYNPLTGAVITGTNLVVPGAGIFSSVATGVDIAPDGKSLYFATHFNNIATLVQTDLAGNLLDMVAFSGNSFVEDIALQQPGSAVPLPPSLMLLGSGLLGLAGWRRFRQG
jgi:hypothetical protein